LEHHSKGLMQAWCYYQISTRSNCFYWRCAHFI